jgi:hypothetical protein
MADSWFASPDTVRLDLPGGHWIEVKRELTVREERAVVGAFIRATQKDAEGGEVLTHVNPEGLGARVKAYLVDWSLRDAQDKPVKCTPAAIDALRADKFALIDAALDAYLTTRDAEKNVPGGTSPAATSASAA